MIIDLQNNNNFDFLSKIYNLFGPEKSSTIYIFLPFLNMVGQKYLVLQIFLEKIIFP